MNCCYGLVLILATFVLVGCQSAPSSIASASHELCVYGVRNWEGDGVTFTHTPNARIDCETRKNLQHLVRGLSLVLDMTTITCVLVPDPFVSKGVALIAGVGGLGLHTVDFALRTMTCDQNDAFSPEQKKQVEQLLCTQIGGKMRAGRCDVPED